MMGFIGINHPILWPLHIFHVHGWILITLFTDRNYVNQQKMMCHMPNFSALAKVKVTRSIKKIASWQFLGGDIPLSRECSTFIWTWPSIHQLMSFFVFYIRYMVHLSDIMQHSLEHVQWLKWHQQIRLLYQQTSGRKWVIKRLKNGVWEDHNCYFIYIFVCVSYIHI